MIEIRKTEIFAKWHGKNHHYPAAFQAARVVAGSVEWPGEVDLSYDTLYLESRPIAVSGAVAEE